mgnify:CR=1 FL=1
MNTYRINRLQILPISIETAWDFFSNPLNLSAITPPWLNFRVTSSVAGRMYPGMIITYQLTPVAGFPVNWVSEITHVREPMFFVDEQRIGPYRFWHHQHVFTPIDVGVEMTDIVHYQLPLGPVGRVFHNALVRKKLEAIFDYRRKVLRQLFGKETAGK